MADQKGVAFNPPPPNLLQQATRIAIEGGAPLAENEVAVVGIVTDAGTNAVIVAKVKGGVEIAGWIGKNWGSKINCGVGIQKRFKF